MNHMTVTFISSTKLTLRKERFVEKSGPKVEHGGITLAKKTLPEKKYFGQPYKDNISALSSKITRTSRIAYNHQVR